MPHNFQHTVHADDTDTDTVQILHFLFFFKTANELHFVEVTGMIWMIITFDSSRVKPVDRIFYFHDPLMYVHISITCLMLNPIPRNCD